jgi:solute carrier family 25 phosphate transporter 23/24/25/41
VLLRRPAHTRCKFSWCQIWKVCKSANELHSDVLRRRFQVNTMTGMGYKYKSIFDAIRVITAQEGIAGLYKGISPNLLKVAPSMAASWLSFEMTRDYILSLKPEEDDDI